MPSLRSGKGNPLAWALLLGLIVTGAAVAWQFSAAPPDEQPAVSDTQPEMPSSPFLNTAADVKAIGIERCAECHQEQYEGYLQTAHATALAKVDPSAQPPDAEFLHEKSERQYAVERRDEQLVHSESHLASSGEEVPLQAHPLKYVVGSGRFARTYLSELDGFLVESPITWFARRARWDMSPGYDANEHSSFHRLIVPECLSCHTGSFEAVEDSRHRYLLHEHAIGCERCHGPGELHAAKHADGKIATDDRDLSIVNPQHLSRELVESICSACHLSGEASVFAEGRDFGTFRPGLPLQEFRHEYRFADNAGQMTVTGHVEQMHQSACYQQTETLTCTTCHDPHAPEANRSNAAKDRACLECHSDGDQDECGKPLQARLAVGDNHCVACHMPEVPTEILHVAFTHHRIGIHDLQPTDTEAESPEPMGVELAPIQDLSHLSPLGKARSLGLAYFNLHSRGLANNDGSYLARAEKLLGTVYTAEEADPVVTSTLAMIAGSRTNWQQALALADETLAANPDRTSRDSALALRGEALAYLGRFEEAIPTLQRLTHLRRMPQEWYLLGICHEKLGQTEPAIKAFEQAFQIDPGQGLASKSLYRLYMLRGDVEKAKQHFDHSEQVPLNGFRASR